MARLFGTDGVRGLANVAPMSPEVVMELGRAAVQVLAHASPRASRPCSLGVIPGCPVLCLKRRWSRVYAGWR